LISRYSRDEIAAVWSDERRMRGWLEVELAATDAWAANGKVPQEAAAACRERARFTVEAVKERERETNHDVAAFVDVVAGSIGEEGRWIHYGLTSSDVLDTALALQLVEAGLILISGATAYRDALVVKAREHAETLCVGRTHGVHAEPTTFGLKLAVWYDELGRQIDRLIQARRDMAVGKVSGAVGTHAHVAPEMEDEVCRALELRPAPASTQIIQRDRHAFFLSVLAVIGGTIEKMALEIRHLQRTEVREAEEPFDPGNQGSSAMPHKRNPHASERLGGLARLLRGYALVGDENIALWHERDISHSSTERVIFPDACIVLDFMIAEATDLIERLVVYPERMRRNLELTGGAIYSQPVLLALVDAGMDRQAAYKLVQRHALAAWDEGRSLRDALLADDEVRERLGPERIDRLFDPTAQLTHVDAVFQRLGLLPAAGEASNESGDSGEERSTKAAAGIARVDALPSGS
jgi:adenylosuccinate lyase